MFTYLLKILGYKITAIGAPGLVGHLEPGADPDGLQDVLAVRDESLEPGDHPVLNVTGQTLYVHWFPVLIVIRDL